MLNIVTSRYNYEAAKRSFGRRGPIFPAAGIGGSCSGCGFDYSASVFSR